MSSKPTASENLCSIRHWLRTPLNHTIGYSEALLEDGADENEAKILRAIISDAQTICDLIAASSPEPKDPDLELERLRRGILPVAEVLQDRASVLPVGRDVGRIRSAATELLRFAETGEFESIGVEGFVGNSHPRGMWTRASGKLLVVDDDEGNRDVLERHLSRQGFHVEQAASGAEALDRLRASRYDAVLLDLVMPGMNGFEVLAEIKTDSALRSIPVLVISASDELGAIADSIERGAEDYLFKPFDPVVLRARLSAALERNRLREQERQRNTELEQITAALKRSNEDLQRFAYAASHDLQAPVRTITSYLQLLERRLGPRLKDDEREMIGFAQNAAKRMHALIRDLLSYSHASTGAVHFTPVQSEDLLAGLIEDMSIPISESKGIVTWDQPSPVLLADPTALRQILQNLISNALKYHRDGEPPVVHVSTSEESEHWRFCVRDNGQGIAPEYVARIFEMFQRLHGEERPGSGIGLAICQRLVERLGGKIWVDSVPDRGSTFCFTIPKTTPAA